MNPLKKTGVAAALCISSVLGLLPVSTSVLPKTKSHLSAMPFSRYLASARTMCAAAPALPSVSFASQDPQAVTGSLASEENREIIEQANQKEQTLTSPDLPLQEEWEPEKQWLETTDSFVWAEEELEPDDVSAQALESLEAWKQASDRLEKTSDSWQLVVQNYEALNSRQKEQIRLEEEEAARLQDEIEQTKQMLEEYSAQMSSLQDQMAQAQSAQTFSVQTETVIEEPAIISEWDLSASLTEDAPCMEPEVIADDGVCETEEMLPTEGLFESGPAEENLPESAQPRIDGTLSETPLLQGVENAEESTAFESLESEEEWIQDADALQSEYQRLQALCQPLEIQLLALEEQLQQTQELLNDLKTALEEEAEVTAQNAAADEFLTAQAVDESVLSETDRRQPDIAAATQKISSLEELVGLILSNGILFAYRDRSGILNTGNTLLSQARAEMKQLEMKPVYRLCSPTTGNHFYSADAGEVNYLKQTGWTDEGIGWNAPALENEKPVYRLYHAQSGTHLFTADKNEMDYLTRTGWNNEGVAWYSDALYEGMDVYRLSQTQNSKTQYIFTVSFKESSNLQHQGWTLESIAWHGRFPYSIRAEEIDGVSGVVYYQADGQKLTGMTPLFGDLVCLDAQTGFRGSGWMNVSAQGKTINIYCDERGRMAQGFASIDNKTYYFYPGSGEKLKNTWLYAGSSMYRLSAQGNPIRGTFSQGNVTFTANFRGEVTTVSCAVSYLSQLDARWSDEGIGKYTMGGSGCVPTVLTMIINTLKKKSMEPVELARLLYQNQYMNYLVPGTVAEGILWTASQYGLTLRGSLEKERARMLLLRGGMLATAMGPGTFCPAGSTHEVVVFGYKNGNVQVYDSFESQNNGWYSLDLIFSQLSQSSYDNRVGGPVFGLTPDGSLIESL